MFNLKSRGVLTAAVLAGLVAVACSPAAPATSTPAASSTGAPVGISTSGASVIPTPANLSGKLTIAGSSALQPLVDQAAKNFQMANKSVQITVSAGGSGSGRTGVCKGTLDIGASDVPLSANELSSLNCSDAVSTAVTIEAFAVVANQKGPGSVTSLTKEQMQGIFSGTITNWTQLGGDSQGIVVVNRLKGSGTRQSMANHLYTGDDTQFATGASEEDNSQTVANTVGQTPGAVSYLSLAFLSGPGLVTMGIKQGDTVLMPTHDTVATGQWPIGGPGLLITKGTANELETAFISYMISPEFELDPIWASLGFIPPANPAIGNPTGT
jgi:phosphate transport system substrate-binding protein